jgi:hypothetical protein
MFTHLLNYVGAKKENDMFSDTSSIFISCKTSLI